MRILILTVIMALPLMALGQTAEQQQGTTQAQPKETEATAPAKAKKTRPEQEQSKSQAKPETTAKEVKKNQAGARSSTNQTNVKSTNQTTKVNVQKFKARHSEVFSLGRHPKSFFIERFGVQHVRVIANTVFVFVDGCWVAVDADGFVFAERVICAGDPDFIVVE
jgi:cytoskeletal protein RodZ